MPGKLGKETVLDCLQCISIGRLVAEQSRYNLATGLFSWLQSQKLIHKRGIGEKCGFPLLAGQHQRVTLWSIDRVRREVIYGNKRAGKVLRF